MSGIAKGDSCFNGGRYLAVSTLAGPRTQADRSCEGILPLTLKVPMRILDSHPQHQHDQLRAPRTLEECPLQCRIVGTRCIQLGDLGSYPMFPYDGNVQCVIAG